MLALYDLHSWFYMILLAHKVEHLVKLEAKCGPLPNQSPAIDEVLDYLAKVCIKNILIDTFLSVSSFQVQGKQRI